MGFKQLFANTEPQAVLRYFYDISQIPRQSRAQRGISDYLLDFAHGLSLEAFQDVALNVIVKKPASPGYETAPPLMLQAHMDMVCSKLPQVQHDFSRDAIKLVREGDKVSAAGTTLGADDGLGLASAMALLADATLPHPPLEVVFTTDEETDMAGAWALDPYSVSARRIINLDAAAVRVCGAGEIELEMRLNRESTPIKEGYTCYAIGVGGLQGGHTGLDAMLERGNAITLLNRLLMVLGRGIAFQLLYIQGGEGISSAFPREARAVIACAPEEAARLKELAEQQLVLYREELRLRDPHITLTVSPAQVPPEQALHALTTAKLRQLLTLLPDGLFSLNRDFPGAMESTACLGVVETEAQHIHLTLLLRSTSPGKRQYLYHKATLLCESLGVPYTVGHDTPQWQRQLDAGLQQALDEVYADYEFGVAQGTLECGIFRAKWSDSSIVTLAPPYHHPHSPHEYFLISELHESWQRLLALLERLR